MLLRLVSLRLVSLRLVSLFWTKAEREALIRNSLCMNLILMICLFSGVSMVLYSVHMIRVEIAGALRELVPILYEFGL